MEILFEKDVCAYLEIPSIPLKEWNQRDSFKSGVAVTNLCMERFAYAVCSYDSEKENEPRVTKTFAQEPFYGVSKIYVVPSFMETDVQRMDLDDESKIAAERLINESQEIINENTDVDDNLNIPQNEYSFEHIHNDDEAIAFLTSYNKKNNIRGSVPKKHETLVMRLAVIYSDMQRKNGKK